VLRGAVVGTVDPGSPAARAGLRGIVLDGPDRVKDIGDVIISVDGHRIDNYEEMAAYMEKAEPRDKVTLEVVRGDQILKLTIDLREGAGRI
ncbi:MAG TPA: PDZ domain-containing protein, partial [Holophagaceae bacterium]|nr:PDZ domain-containing protein [Holophagaceae bacterium]